MKTCHTIKDARSSVRSIFTRVVFNTITKHFVHSVFYAKNPNIICRKDKSCEPGNRPVKSLTTRKSRCGLCVSRRLKLGNRLRI
jgi:hypothetical protein